MFALRFVVLVVFLTCCPAVGNALTQGDIEPGETQGSTTAATLSSEERARIQADMHVLARALGVEGAPLPEPLKTEKTIAEASDRALSLLEKSVSSVAAGVEKVAPQVWRVAIRQQYAKAIAPLIAPFGWFLGLSILALVLYRKGHAWFHSKDAWNESPGPLAALLGLGALMIIPGGVLLDRLTDSALYLINPEWYALADLIRVLLGKGA